MTISIKSKETCNLFRCIICWMYILPDDSITDYKDGYVHSFCNQRRLKWREYYASHKDIIAASRSRSYMRNKDKVKARQKVYLQRNKERINAYQREYRRKSRERDRRNYFIRTRATKKNIRCYRKRTQ